MSSSRRRPYPSRLSPLGVCPCGHTQAQSGKLWLEHTRMCPQWIAKNAHLFALPEPASSSAGLTSYESNLTLTNELTDQPMRTAQNSKEVSPISEPEVAPLINEVELGTSTHIGYNDQLQVSTLPRLNAMLRALRRPQQVHDVLPTGPTRLVIAGEPGLEDTAQPTDMATHSTLPRIRLLVWHPTSPNIFGLFRSYLSLPSKTLSIPDLRTTYRDLVSTHEQEETILGIINPFPNLSTFLLAHWFFTGSIQKSYGERDRLVHNVLLAPGFSPNDLQGENLRALDHALDRLCDPVRSVFEEGGNWLSHGLEISIPIPRPSRRGNQYSDVPVSSISFDEFGTQVVVPGFHYRKLVDVIHGHFAQSSARPGPIHFVPYRHYWKPNGTLPEERVYDNLYTGNAWLEEHEAVQKLPGVEGCTLERAIIALMWLSDATHIAQFGQASIWPFYLQFGNRPKDDRAKPSLRLTEHIAYLPKITGGVRTEIEKALGGRPISDQLAAHIKREIFHAAWRVLLDDDFVDAYRNGMVILCSDGVKRRLYPRVFTYSADYPEKVSIALIRNFGLFPSIRTLIRKDQLRWLGHEADRRRRTERLRLDNEEHRALVLAARRKIYVEGRPLNSTVVEDLLKSTSSVPTINAFSQRLSEFPGFNLYQMIVPDALHELDLGVCKALLTHLIRMLHAEKGNKLSLFDARFRQITSYPPDVIRKFDQNVSDMKRLAARDFEDILQCSIPCFEGLFAAEDSKIVCVLLFTLTQWHALAKLHMHTESTRCALDSLTSLLGYRLRQFQGLTASKFDTVETDKEFEARKRRYQSNSSNAAKTSTPSTRKAVKFSMTTYKLHALGDYASTISRFGTTDSYSTQNGELEHRHAKAWARRTNNINISQHVGELERREARLELRAAALRRFLDKSSSPESEDDDAPPLPELELLDVHHVIGAGGKIVRFIDFFKQHEGDPAIENFVRDLRDHILERLKDPNAAGTSLLGFSDLSRQSIHFPDGAMYRHSTLRINYTTYNVRRSFNVINPRSKHHFIMLPSGDELPDHPYWYAKVLGIYHINAIHSGGLFSQRTEYLWVRWMEIVELGSWEQSRLDRIQYVPASSYREMFGFVNPACVIRASHLIPAFAFGRDRGGNIPTHSIGLDDTKEGDWKFYYVNRFVDRDMFMRYWGGGPGHIDRHDTNHSNNTDMVTGEILEESNIPTEDNDPDEWEFGGTDEEDTEGSEFGHTLEPDVDTNND